MPPFCVELWSESQGWFRTNKIYHRRGCKNSPANALVHLMIFPDTSPRDHCHFQAHRPLGSSLRSFCVVSRETKERAGEAGKLTEALKAKVKVLEKKTGGRIVIEFKSEEDLKRIMSQILGEAE